MKISRKDLRRIILENLSENRRPNLLKEGVNLNKAYRAGVAFKEDDENQEKKEKAQDYKEQLETAKTDQDGPFRPGKPRAEKAQGVLNFLNRILAANDPATVSAPPPPGEDPAADDAPAGQEPSPEAPETSEWKKYGSETDWEYKIQGASPNQIWITRKAGGDEKVFKLNNRRYKSTVEKLDKDDNMPKRTKESKANDPALKAASSRSSGDQDTDTAQTPPLKEVSDGWKVGPLSKILKEMKVTLDDHNSVSKEDLEEFGLTMSSMAAYHKSNANTYDVYIPHKKGTDDNLESMFHIRWIIERSGNVRGNNAWNQQYNSDVLEKVKKAFKEAGVDFPRREQAPEDASVETGSSVPSPVTFDDDDMAFMRKVSNYQYVNSISLDNKPGTQQFNATTSSERRAALKKVIDWLYAQDIYVGVGGDLSDIEVDDRITVDRAMQVHANWKDDSFEEYKKIINLARNPVGGQTVAPRWKQVLRYTYELFARINERYYAAQRRMNENKVVYGESHASLIRKRYWGRY